MKRYIPYILSALAISGFLGATVYAAQPIFTSFQTGATPSNGYVLQTNGTNSTWVATSTLGITGGTGTNYWTSSGGNIYNNIGNLVQAPAFTATSTTATSTFNGDVWIGSTGVNPNPDLRIGTSSVPLYGRLLGDVIDAEYDYNGVSSINIANANKGTCAAATYFADGNNPTLGGYYGTFSFLNDGWTNGGGAGCGIGVSNTDKAEAVAIASPTGEMDFDIASTTNSGFADFNWNVNNATLMKLTNGGNFGIGSTTPGSLLSIGNTNGINFSTASTTFNSTGGINLIAGCFSIRGTCVGAGGGGAVSSVTATNSTLTISPTTGSVLAGLNLANANAWTAAQTIQSTSANAFTVGANGVTNPAFNVDASAASSVSGITLQSNATGVAPVMQVTDSGTNSGLTIATKGTGQLSLLVGATTRISTGNANNTYTNTSHNFTFNAANGASTVRFSVANVADSALTASTEATHTFFNLGSNVRTHAVGALALQRDMRILGTTHAFATASTLTKQAVLSVELPAAAGTNSTLTNVSAIDVPVTAMTGTVTNAFAFTAAAPSGAGTLNAVSSTTGRVFMNALTTSGSTQTGYLCYNASNELIQDTTTCLVSALKFKKDINPLSQKGAFSAVMNMLPVTYFEKNPLGKESAGQQVGFIADWSATTTPQLVQHDSTGAIHSFNYEQYTAYLTGALQYIEKQVTDILTRQSADEKKIEAQQKEIDSLQAQINNLKK